jgi:hypothetical protein
MVIPYAFGGDPGKTSRITRGIVRGRVVFYDPLRFTRRVSESVLESNVWMVISEKE